MNKFHLVQRLLDQAQLIRPKDNPNEDLLISKPNLYTYIDRENLGIIDKLGIPTPEYIDAKLEKFKTVLQNLRHPSPNYHKCILCFFCRVPQDLPTSPSFLERFSPVRILLNRIKRSNEDFKMLSCNFPNNSNSELNEDDIHKLCQKEALFYNYFKNSKHPFFLDVPMIAIQCTKGFLPGFSCKILDKADNEEKTING
jgi:hypothetical protein